ncbi:hypothetical protein H6F86_16320 [Phormidium sp. FACHB-592]|uniref:Uncharacterized protein n=1 Tax=Stenomitos frigidus AS-A4 TaxID=2933935 RepID=A0ABV0KQT1_9CYAN|nr:MULTISPECIES: hypothetical protein [Cyanophyceae]MBD2034064.1 hypothetical protein [Leptolyngbya sp. FACHB-321]MBD2075430.1 hypothetical protein [Phormidium sp. FACHB-592]
MTSTCFLTVESDPDAEEAWKRFSCNDTVRLTSPDFRKSLQQMFAHKPAGQYLVKVTATLELSQLDFEPQVVPPASNLEEPDNWYNADHATTVCRHPCGQVEAEETSDLPWTEDPQTAVAVGQTEGDDFDPERHF